MKINYYFKHHLKDKTSKYYNFLNIFEITDKLIEIKSNHEITINNRRIDYLFIFLIEYMTVNIHDKTDINEYIDNISYDMSILSVFKNCGVYCDKLTNNDIKYIKNNNIQNILLNCHNNLYENIDLVELVKISDKIIFMDLPENIIEDFFINCDKKYLFSLNITKYDTMHKYNLMKKYINYIWFDLYMGFNPEISFIEEIIKDDKKLCFKLKYSKYETFEEIVKVLEYLKHIVDNFPVHHILIDIELLNIIYNHL